MVCENKADKKSNPVELFGADDELFPKTNKNDGIELTLESPNMDYDEFLRRISFGEKYYFNKLVIECIFAQTEDLLNKCVSQMLVYQKGVGYGDETLPLYPFFNDNTNPRKREVCVFKKIDIDAKTSIRAYSIPSGCKVRYTFICE